MSERSNDEQAAATPAEVREQVERTRAELGETVQALADKADVKARAKEKTAEVRRGPPKSRSRPRRRRAS